MKRLTHVVALLGATVLSGGMACAATSSPAASAGDARPPSVEALLAQSKAAMGGVAWDDIRSLSMKGTATMGGLSVSTSSLQDLSSGQWARSVEGGPIRQREGFDGKAAWQMGNNNELSIHKPPTASDVTNTYKNAYGWWYPKRWSAKIAWAGQQQSQGKAFDVLHITPQGGVPFDLWIDAQTHFIARFVGVTDGLARTTSLEDYRDVHGIELPFLEQVTDSTLRHHEVMQIATANVNVPVNAQDFAPPQPGQDISLAGGADKVTLPFQFTDGTIYIPVKIDGHTFRFILDTGGTNTLSPQAAQVLGIVGKGSIAPGGLGSGHVTESYARMKSLTLGDKVTLHDQAFNIVLPPVHDADGAIGGSSLFGVVSRIDYAAHELTLIRPAAFNAASAGTPLPIQVRHGLTLVQASVGGVPGWFAIDTGFNSLVLLNTPFASKHDLYTRFHAVPPSSGGHGYNGKIDYRVAYNQEFKMGPIDAQLPGLLLSTETEGASATQDMADMIGTGILKHLTLTTDYANNTVYIKQGG